MVNFLWKTFPTKALSVCACVGERTGGEKEVRRKIITTMMWQLLRNARRKKRRRAKSNLETKNDPNKNKLIAALFSLTK